MPAAPPVRRPGESIWGPPRVGRGAATAAWGSPGLCVPVCAPVAAVQGRSRPSIGVDRARLSCAFVRGRTTADPTPPDCQVHGRQGEGTGAPLYP